eukprot:GEMP01000129.1.p1 GENE.GEMP01000129.1~~GEMP01000129.1.p1  ORF type:complete len:3041 (+),score=512.92 GEMP01000129.1:1243-9123(+)
MVGPLTHPEEDGVGEYGSAGDRLFLATNLTCKDVPDLINPALGPMSEESPDGINFIWPAGIFLKNVMMRSFALCYFPQKWQEQGVTFTSLQTDPTRVAVHIGTVKVTTCLSLSEKARSTEMGTECKCSEGYYRNSTSEKCDICPEGNFCPENVAKFESVEPVRCPLLESTDKLTPSPAVSPVNCECAKGHFRMYAPPLTPSSLRAGTTAFGASLKITFFVFPPRVAQNITYLVLKDGFNELARIDEPLSESFTLDAALPDSMQQSIADLDVHIYGLALWEYIYLQIEGIEVGYFLRESGLLSLSRLTRPGLEVRKFSNTAGLENGLRTPCRPCQPGKFKSKVSNDMCLDTCDSKRPNSMSDEGATVVHDCYCSPHYYFFLDAGGGECRSCTGSGVTCLGGFDPDKGRGHHIRPFSNPGFWLVNDTLAEVVPCLARASCYGRNTCAEGNDGWACGRCKMKFTRESYTDVCVECPTNTVEDALLICLVFILYVCLITIVSGITIKGAKNEKGLHSVVVKIFTNYMLCIGVLGGFSFRDSQWPDWVLYIWSGSTFASEGTPSSQGSFDCLLRNVAVNYLYYDISTLDDSALIQNAIWIVVPLIMLFFQMLIGWCVLIGVNYRIKVQTLDMTNLSHAQNKDKFAKWNMHALLRRDHKEYDFSLRQYVQKRRDADMLALCVVEDPPNIAIQNCTPMETTESPLAYVTTRLCRAYDVQKDLDDLRFALCGPNDKLLLFDASLFELQILTDSIEILREACQKHQQCDVDDIAARKFARSAIEYAGQRVRILEKMAKRALRTEVNVILDLPHALFSACSNFEAASIGLLCLVKTQLRESLALHERNDAAYVADMLDGAIYFGGALVSQVCGAVQALDVLDHAEALRTEWNEILAPETERALADLRDALMAINLLEDCEEDDVQDEFVLKLLCMCDTRFANLPRTAQEVATWSGKRVEPFLKRMVGQIEWKNYYLLEAFVKGVTVDLVPHRPLADTPRREKELEVRVYLLRTCAHLWRTEMDVDPEVLLEILSSVPDEVLAQLCPAISAPESSITMQVAEEVNAASLAAQILAICKEQLPKRWALAQMKPCVTRILRCEVDLEALFCVLNYLDERQLTTECAPPEQPVNAEDPTWAVTVTTTLLRAVIERGSSGNSSGGVAEWGKVLIRPKIWPYCVDVLYMDCDFLLHGLNYMTPEEVHRAVEQVEHIPGVLEVTNHLIQVLKQSSPLTWALAYLRPLASLTGTAQTDVDIESIISDAVPLMPMSALEDLVTLRTLNSIQCRNKLMALARQHFPDIYARSVMKQKLDKYCDLQQVNSKALFSIALPYPHLLMVLFERERAHEMSGADAGDDKELEALDSLLQLAKKANPSKYFEAMWRLRLRALFDGCELEEEAFYAGLSNIPLARLERLNAAVQTNTKVAVHQILDALREYSPKEWGHCKLKQALGRWFSKDSIGELDPCGLDKVVQLATEGDRIGAKRIALAELRKANVVLWAQHVLEERCRPFWPVSTVFTERFIAESSVGHLCRAVTMAVEKNEWAEAAAFLFECYQKLTSQSDAHFTGDFRIGHREIAHGADQSLTSFLFHTNTLASDVRTLQLFNCKKRHLKWFTAYDCRDVFFQFPSDDAREDMPHFVNTFKLLATEKDKYVIAAKKPGGKSTERYYLTLKARGGVEMTSDINKAQVFVIKATSGYSPRTFPQCLWGHELKKTSRQLSADTCMFCTREITVPKKECFSCVECDLISCNRCAKKTHRTHRNAHERAPLEKQECIVVSIDVSEGGLAMAAGSSPDLGRNNTKSSGSSDGYGKRSLDTIVEPPMPDAAGLFHPKGRGESILILEPDHTRALGLWSYFCGKFPQKSTWGKRRYFGDVLTCIVIMAFFLHTNVTHHMLTLIDCTTELSRDLESRLRSNPDIICYKGLGIWGVVSVAGLIVWTIGIPLVAWLYMKRKRAELFSSMSTRQTFGFLYQGFEPEYYYWEIVILFRKILVRICAIIPVPDETLRLFYYMILAAISLATHQQFSPYDNRGIKLLDRLESKALWSWLITVAMLTVLLVLDYGKSTNLICAFLMFLVQMYFVFFVLYYLVRESVRHVRGELSAKLTSGEGHQGHLSNRAQLLSQKELKYFAMQESRAKEKIATFEKRLLRIVLYLVPLEKEINVYYRPLPPQIGIVVVCPPEEIEVDESKRDMINGIYTNILSTGISKLQCARACADARYTFEATWTFFDYFMRQIVFLVRNEIMQKDLTYQRLGTIKEIVSTSTFIRNKVENVENVDLQSRTTLQRVRLGQLRKKDGNPLSPEDVFFTLTLDEFYSSYKVADRLIIDMKMWELQRELAGLEVENEKAHTQYLLHALHQKDAVQMAKIAQPGGGLPLVTTVGSPPSVATPTALVKSRRSADFFRRTKQAKKVSVASLSPIGRFHRVAIPPPVPAIPSYLAEPPDKILLPGPDHHAPQALLAAMSTSPLALQPPRQAPPPFRAPPGYLPSISPYIASTERGDAVKKKQKRSKSAHGSATLRESDDRLDVEPAPTGSAGVDSLGLPESPSMFSIGLAHGGWSKPLPPTQLPVPIEMKLKRGRTPELPQIPGIPQPESNNLKAKEPTKLRPKIRPPSRSPHGQSRNDKTSSSSSAARLQVREF